MSSRSAGTHTITLTAKDPQGATGTATRSLNVIASSGAGTTTQAPVASFTWTCTAAGLRTHQCQLDGTGSTDDHGVVSWTWNWGNGNPTETKTVNPARNTWAAAGTYTVTLTVTDANGLTGTIAKSVVVP